MSDYDDIIGMMREEDYPALEEVALMLDDFPTGKDDWLQRYWIINAIDMGSLTVVEWMLKHGAPVNVVDEEGYSPLLSALERKDDDKYALLQVLVRAGADMHLHGIHEWTPLHMAAARNDLKALELFHAAGADFSVRTEIDNYATPLEEAQIIGAAPDTITYLKTLSGSV